MDRIYLDHGASSPVDPEVFAAMQPIFLQYYGNPSSNHSFGTEARALIEDARAKIASFLHAKPDEIIFTGSGTEADNMAILGTAYKLRKIGTHVITSSIEHPAVRNPFKKLAVDGFEVTTIAADSDGLVHVEDVEKAIRPDTTLISIMLVNNEIGTIQPIKEIGEIARNHGIIFHTDAVQAVGKLPINLQELPVDLLSASAHKFYGPKGVGFLYYRESGMHPQKNRFIQPILFGGGHEFGMRPATENAPGIVGMAKALELACQNMDRETARLKTLRDDFIDWVLTNIPNSILNGHRTKRLFNNINIRFQGVDGEELQQRLNNAGIAVSTGSACASKSQDGSYVMRAIESEEAAYGTIRITMGKSTTPEMLEYVKTILQKEVESLRKHV
jgi:cysteine desulfurase